MTGTEWVCKECGASKFVFVKARSVICVRRGHHASRGAVYMRPTRGAS